MARVVATAPAVVVISPVNAGIRAAGRVPELMFDAFNDVKLAPDTAPNEPDQVPLVIVPTEVREEPVTPEPNVVAERTDVPLISYTLPVTKLKSSEEVQPIDDQVIDLSVAPLRVIPPPSAVTSVGEATEPNSIFLSSTVIVVALMVVVVPLIVKSPVTTKLFLTVVVPVVAPIVTAVPAANNAGDVGVAKKEVEPTVASIDVSPAIVVLEAPNEIAVVPTVTELFAKFALVIPAVPERLLLVKPEIVFEPAAIVLLVRVSEPARVAKVPVVGSVNEVLAVAVKV